MRGHIHPAPRGLTLTLMVAGSLMIAVVPALARDDGSPPKRLARVGLRLAGRRIAPTVIVPDLGVTGPYEDRRT